MKKAYNYTFYAPEIGPLVKVKIENFKPVHYEIEQTIILASLSSGSKLPFGSAVVKAKVAIEALQEREGVKFHFPTRPDGNITFRNKMISRTL